MNILESFSKYQKFIILGCLLLAILFLIDRPLGVGTIFIFFLASVTLFIIGRYMEEKQGRVLGMLFLIVFLLHILAVVLLYYTHFQPFSGGYGDWITYHPQAQEIAGRLHQGNFSLKGLNIGHFYPVIVGYIYALTIPSMLIGQLFNAWLVALSIIFVYLIIREIGGTEKESFLTGLVACFYPSLAFYGSFLLKDATVVVLSMAGLFLTIKLMKNFSILKFLVFFTVLTGLIHFRFYIGYALMFCFIISWFLISHFHLKKRIIYGIIILFILGLAPQFTGSGYYGFDNFKNFLNAKTITYYREIVYAPPVKSNQSSNSHPGNISSALLEGTTGTTSSVTVKTGFGRPTTFIENTALSFAYSLLGPFPWQLTRLAQFLALFEVIAWYFFLFFIIKGIINSTKTRHKIILPLIIFSCFIIGVLAIFINNFGITTRIRMPAFLALLCILPLGLEKLNNMRVPLLSKIFEA